MDHQTPSAATSAAADDFLQDDYALADSFINFDYEPDADSPIEERIKQTSFVNNAEELEEGEFVADDVNFDAVLEDVDDNAGGDVRNGNAAEISPSETTRNDGYELEEGEILDSDVSAANTDDEDGDERRGVRVDGGDRSQAGLENDHQIRPRVNVRLRPHHQMHSTLPGHGNYGTRKRLASATNVNPRFPHAPGHVLVGAVNPPFLHASGVWRNGTTLAHAPAMPLHANGHYFPLPGVWTNGVPGTPHQLLLPGFPHQFQQHFNPGQGFPHQFQQHFNPGQGFPPANVYRGMLQPPFQPPIQFNPGSSAPRGRSNLRGRTFHRGGRKGWRPPM